MKQITVLLLLTITMITAPLFAEPHKTTTTTYQAGIEGVANCTSIILTVTRTVQNDGSANTTLQYAVKECEPGATIPTRLIAYFTGPMPEGSYTLNRTGGGSHLVYPASDGPIDIRWDPIAKNQPNAFHNSYSATWLFDSPTETRKETQETDTIAARPFGILAGRIADGRRASLTVTTGVVDIK